jgi:hypothetical protein
MNVKFNKTTPISVPQNSEPSQPLAPNARLDPVLLDLIGNVKEKKNEKSDKMSLSD